MKTSSSQQKIDAQSTANANENCTAHRHSQTKSTADPHYPAHHPDRRYLLPRPQVPTTPTTPPNAAAPNLKYPRRLSPRQCYHWHHPLRQATRTLTVPRPYGARRKILVGFWRRHEERIGLLCIMPQRRYTTADRRKSSMAVPRHEIAQRSSAHHSERVQSTQLRAGLVHQS